MPEIAPRRWLYLFLVLASTVAAVTQMAGVLQFDGFTLREIVILSLFAILFAWIAMSFWLALFTTLISVPAQLAPAVSNRRRRA